MKKNVPLSERLRLISSFVPEGKRLADIGTDHGYVPVYLVYNGIIPSAIAMDINPGPLRKAQENVDFYGTGDKIELRLSDGMEKLKENEADTVIIAGMGGRLIKRIMDNAKDICRSINEFILSPHSEIEVVRQYLMENGYEIIREQMIFDDGKYYTVMKAVHGKMEFGSVEELLYGKKLLENKDRVLKEYLTKEREKFKLILNKLSGNSEGILRRRAQVEESIMVLERALSRYI